MKPIMNERAIKLLSELLKDSRKSDRTLAKVLGVSQPTITRMRSKLAKNGIIQEFTIIPNFVKLDTSFSQSPASEPK